MSNEEQRPPIRVVPRILTPEQIASSAELVRRQEWRQRYLVPIYLMWTENVPSQEAGAAQQGVLDAMRASGQHRELVVFGSTAYGSPDTPYSSPDWYVQEALRNQPLRRNAGFGPQVDVSAITPLFTQEPYQNQPHWEVFVVGHDLNTRGQDDQYINFVFGATQPEFAASVQSIRRLIAEIPEGQLRLAMIRRLLRHEVGHMFQLPLRDQNTRQLLGKHCTNVCTMRQGLSIQVWAQMTTEEDTKGVHFCGNCQADFARLRGRYIPLPPQPH